MSGSISRALIPYTPPKTPMEFIHSEVLRGLKNGTITSRQLLQRPSIQPIFHVIELPLGNIAIAFDKIPFLELSKATQTHIANFCVDQLEASRRITHVASAALDPNEIVEILQSEVGFTSATDKKPIVATYGCAWCVALGGYDPNNHTAFIVHFSNVKEIIQIGGTIYENIRNLAQKKVKKPIQLHIRGGIMSNESTDIIKGIMAWMTWQDKIPMEIASEDTFSGCFGGESLSIDSRTGSVSGYDPLTNPRARKMNEFEAMSRLLSAIEPNVQLVYSPAMS